MNRLFTGASLSAAEAMLRFASERQKLLAGNIANVDTVGYRSRDLTESDFRRMLAGIVEIRPGPAADAGALKPGGNNVDLEIEMAKMARNSALHSTAAALLAQQFTLLREAIAGRVL